MRERGIDDELLIRSTRATCMPEVEEREAVVSPAPQTALSGGRSAPASLSHYPPPTPTPHHSATLLPPASFHHRHTPLVGCAQSAPEAKAHIGSFQGWTSLGVRFSGSRRAEGNSCVVPTWNNPAIHHHPGWQAATKLINKQTGGGEEGGGVWGVLWDFTALGLTSGAACLMF